MVTVGICTSHPHEGAHKQVETQSNLDPKTTDLPKTVIVKERQRTGHKPRDPIIKAFKSLRTNIGRWTLKKGVMNGNIKSSLSRLVKILNFNSEGSIKCQCGVRRWLDCQRATP